MMAEDPIAGDYVLYADKSKSLSGLNKRMLFIIVPLVSLAFLFARAYSHGFSIPVHAQAPPHLVRNVHVQFDPASTVLFSWFPWFLLAEGAFFYVLMARSYLKQKKPIIILSAEGISVDTSGTHLGLIRWDEIEEVRSYTFIYRVVGIVPKNYRALYQRLGTRRSWLLNLNSMCISLYKPFGLFVAPINIPQVHLSITADELLAHIRAYQAVYGQEHPNLQSVAGLTADKRIWPPPPASNRLDH